MNYRQYNVDTRQTHFIGVFVPENISVRLEQCRTWMNARFGCKSGFGTPLHVTLVPPFLLPDNMPADTVADAVATSIELCINRKIIPFTACIKGFGSFSERTVFAHVVPDTNWTVLQKVMSDSLSDALPGVFHRDRRPFTPHITVANRDIPPGGVTEALDYFASMELDTAFSVKSVTVFERIGSRWIAADS